MDQEDTEKRQGKGGGHGGGGHSHYGGGSYGGGSSGGTSTSTPISGKAIAKGVGVIVVIALCIWGAQTVLNRNSATQQNEMTAI